MRTAIIDYGSGNLRSAAKAFERAAQDTEIACQIVVTDDPLVVASADRIVLPGVGTFADCRAGLAAIDGMASALIDAVERRAVPFLGICVGMQLMASRELEKSVTDGFGWIAGDVVMMTPTDCALKIPQIGWNTIAPTIRHPVLEGIATGPTGLHAYFVHSYHLAADNPSQLLALSDYGGEIAAIVGRDNMLGTQFHPEKSQLLGLSLIANFLSWAP